jgi:hypothetical protein
MISLIPLRSVSRPPHTKRIVRALLGTRTPLLWRGHHDGPPHERRVCSTGLRKRRHLYFTDLHSLFGVFSLILERKTQVLQILAASVLLLTLPACHAHRVTYGETTSLPLVHTSTDHRRIYVAADVEGDHVWFLDTGNPFTTCDSGLIEHLKLKTHGKKAYAGIMGRGVASLADLPPLHLGTHQVDGVRCMVRDLTTTSSIIEPEEVPVAGILGLDVLSHFRFKIDLASGTLTLRTPSAEDLALPTPIRWSPLTQRMRVETQIGTASLHMIVDTGATDSILDGDSLGLEPSQTSIGLWIRGSGRGGSNSNSLRQYREEVVLDGLELGIVEFTDIPQGPSLLGLDVLSLVGSDWSPRYHRAHLTGPVDAKLQPWSQWKSTGEQTPFRVQGSSKSSACTERSSAGGNK